MLTASLVVAAALGCSDADPLPADGPVAVFEITPDGPLPFAALPFPSDLHLDDGGQVDIAELPLATPLWQDMLELLNGQDGFCTSCTVHFPVRGQVDPASLGGDAAVGEAASALDPVVMLELGSDPPELVPLRVESNAADSLITVRPTRGLILRPNRRYAVALTSAVRAPSGAPAQPEALFAAVRDGGGGAAAERARAIIGPGLDELGAAGVDRASVVAATVFTTWDPVQHEQAVAALIDEHYAAAGAPGAALDQIWRGDDGSLDVLLGTPADPQKPGFDAEPLDPVADETRAVRHETTAFLLAGSFPAPRIVTGEGAEVGRLRRDAAGQLEAGPAEAVPFLLTIPSGADVTNLPLAVVHWGVGGRRQSSLVFADTLGSLGIAVLGIDAYQHGARAASAKDTAHDMRGDNGFLGPDGLAEHDSLGVSLRMFGVGDVELAGSPRYALGALSQLAADLLATIRFVHDGDLTALGSADPALAGLAFDPARIFFIGESLGTIAGSAALAVTDATAIAAAVLAVSPGSLLDIFSESPIYRNTMELFLLPSLGIEGDFDEVNRRLTLDPLLNLFRWALEPLEPQALARRLFADPITGAGGRSDVLWQYGDLDESIGSGVPDALIAALGVAGVGGFPLADVQTGSLPLSDNVTTPTGQVTGGAFRFTTAGHGLLGFIKQTSGYEPPIVPPFVKRTAVLQFENPTELSHSQLAAFFSSRMATGRAEIRQPE